MYTDGTYSVHIPVRRSRWPSLICGAYSTSRTHPTDLNLHTASRPGYLQGALSGSIGATSITMGKGVEGRSTSGAEMSHLCCLYTTQTIDDISNLNYEILGGL